MGQLLHSIRDLTPIPGIKAHHIAFINVRQAAHDAAHPTFGPRLTALSAAPVMPVHCKHGKPADWMLAGSRRSAWMPGAGTMPTRSAAL